MCNVLYFKFNIELGKQKFETFIKEKMAYSRYRSRKRYTPRRRASYAQSAPRRRSYKRTTTPKRSRRRSTRMSEGGTQAGKPVSGTRDGDKYVLSQANPFDSNVDGVKIPDANSQPSTPFKTQDVFDVVTGAAETCRCIGVNPVAVKTFFGSSPVDASSWTWGASYGQFQDSGKLTQMRSDFELFRPVAHAVRITSGLSPISAVGFVHVAVFTMSTYAQTTWACPTSLSQLQSVPGYKRYPIGRLTGEGLTVVNRPLDCTSQRYLDSDSAVFGSSAASEFNVPCQWGVILVAISGVAAATTPVSIENVTHFECIPRSTSISQSTPASAYNVTALAGAASAQAHSSVSALDSEVPQRTNEAVNIALNAMGRVGQGKLPRIAGRFKARLPNRGAAGSRMAMANSVPGTFDDGM